MMATASESYTLTLEQMELAVESAVKAATPGRQTAKNLALAIAAGKKAFRRRVRSLAKQGGN